MDTKPQTPDHIARLVLNALTLTLVLSTTLVPPASAQVDHPNLARGLAPKTSTFFSEPDSINTFNGSLSLAIPIGGEYPLSESFSYRFAITYNSNAWDFIVRRVDPLNVPDSYLQAHPAFLNNAGFGYMLSLGKYLPANAFGSLSNDQPMYVSPDGARHAFYPKLHDDDDATDDARYTRDGSYLRLTIETLPGKAVIEHPDGRTSTFLPYSRPNWPFEDWRLTRMEDPFGNYLEVAYDDRCEGPFPQECFEEWSLSDSVGRNHTIKFRHSDMIDVGIPGGDGETIWTPVEGMQISRVQLAAPDGESACYRFDYTWVEVPRHYRDTDDENSESVVVRFLDRITYPDLAGSDTCSAPCSECSFSTFTYRENASEVLTGELESMRLPTGGVIEWEYVEYTFPEGDSYCDNWPGNSPVAYGRAVGESLGVYKRELKGEPEESGAWYYVPQDGVGAFDPSVSRTIYDPNGNTTGVYYNTLVDRCSGTQVPSWPIAWHGWDYGLPYDLESPSTITSPSGEPLYLSKRIYQGSGPSADLMRSEYVRYEHDKLPVSTDADLWYNTNRRLVETQTVFNDDPSDPSDPDDPGRYRGELYGSFDGLGHYRSRSLFGDIEPNGARSKFVGYNPNPVPPVYRWYSIDTATNEPPSGMHNYVPWDASDPWILGLYDQKFSYRDDAYKLAEFCFEPSTGFLEGKRLHRREVNDTRDIWDVIQVFTQDSSAPGNVGQIDYYGAEASPVVNSPALSACEPGASATISYTVHRDHEYGVLSTQYMDSGAVTINSVDRDIDLNSGLVLTERDVSAYSTAYTYDKLGRVTSVTPTDGGFTEISYSPAAGEWPNITPAAVVITAKKPVSPFEVLTEGRFEYDAVGRLKKESHHLPGATGWNQRLSTYNALGWPLSVSEWQPDGATTVEKTEFLNYDPFGRPGTVVFPDGHLKYSYFKGVRLATDQIQVGTTMDAVGNVSETWAKTEREYGLAGELLKVVQYAAPSSPLLTAAYSYDVGENLTEAALTAGGVTQVRSFDYDGLGFLLSVEIPEKANMVEYWKYDALGNAGRVTEGTRDLEFDFDGFGRLSKVREFGETLDLKTYLYYPSPELPGYLNNYYSWGKLGGTIRNSSFELGPPPSPTIDFQVQHTYYYDGIGGAISKVETDVGFSPGAQGTFTQEYLWDDLGNLARLHYPDLDAIVGLDDEPDRKVDYTYDLGWLTKIEQPTDSDQWATLANAFSYYSNGMLSGFYHGNGVYESFGLDITSYIARPKSISVNVNGTSNDWSSGDFSYDGAGNIIGIGDKSFAYDKASRLTQFLDGNGGTYKSCGEKSILGYDGFGNITYHDRAPLRPVGDTCPPEPPDCDHCSVSVDSSKNQLTDYPCDEFGNQAYISGHLSPVGQFHYNVFNEVTQIDVYDNDGNDIWHAFDVDGERIARWAAGGSVPTKALSGTIFSIRDINGRVLREYQHDGSEWAWSTDYIWAGSRLLAIVDETGRRHIHPDHLGSTRLVTDQSGNRISYHEYYPLGIEITPPYQDDVAMKFTGHERDSLADSGTYYDIDYMHARFFTHAHGRFLSLDPALANPNNPQSWHPYAYVLNNPIRYRDPWGLTGEDTGGAAADCDDGAPGDQACVEPVEPIDEDDWGSGFAKTILLALSATPDDEKEEPEPSSGSEAAVELFGYDNSLGNRAEKMEDDITNTTAFIAGNAVEAGSYIWFSGVRYEFEYFHRTIKKNILKDAGRYKQIVGNRPNVDVKDGTIYLLGQGPYKGKIYNTLLKAKDYF